MGLLAQEVSDLCLGKPPLRALSLTATISDALAALRNSEESFVSVWNCDHIKVSIDNSNKSGLTNGECECECVGKVGMVDVICYLSKDENLLSPSDALKNPVSEILPKIPGIVMHVEPSCSLLEAIDLMLEGVQNLVIPIRNKLTTRRRHVKSSPNSRTLHGGVEFCWLTQEDIIRYFLNSIAVFSAVASLSIDALDVISTNTLTVDYYSPAISALDSISQSLADQTSVAVVDGPDGTLIGEISPLTLGCCHETVAAAIATLSVGELMAYIDCCGPPEDLVKLVEQTLKAKGLEGMLQYFENISSNCTSACVSTSSSSSDEESMVGRSSSGKFNRSTSWYSARMMRRSEAIVCSRKSSLVAVMIQAIAHRVSYVWVMEENCSLIGIVTFSDILKVLREHFENMGFD